MSIATRRHGRRNNINLTRAFGTAHSRWRPQSRRNSSPLRSAWFFISLAISAVTSRLAPSPASAPAPAR